MYGRLDQMTHVYCSIDPKENFYIPFVVSLYLDGEIQMMKVDQFVKNRPKKVQKRPEIAFFTTTPQKLPYEQGFILTCDFFVSV